MTTNKRRTSSFPLFTLLYILNFFLFLTYAEFVVASSADSDFYYYSSSQKKTLVLSNELLAVRFKENASLDKKEQIVNSDQNLASFTEKQELLQFKITFLPLKGGKTEEDIIQTINMPQKYQIDNEDLNQ